MSGKERRKEQRYVVDAVQLAAGGVRFPVIDLSRTGARISCSPQQFARIQAQPISLEFTTDTAVTTFAIDARLIRSMEMYVVVGYSPPRSDWEEFIRQFDTFHVRELDVQLFD